jgi:4-diphosphocytidyl-2-C-methyl-D-erythritol kinase
MNLRQNESKQTVQAPAKLNLFLEVFGRREDGFHELETLLIPVRLYDSLSFESTPSERSRPGDIIFRMRSRDSWPGMMDSPDSIPSDSSNLVVRTLELFRERSGCERGARVDLVKRIPNAAGLGGGSSDAAAALRIANRCWRIGWAPERLADLAAELGSDVPFFLAPGAAICRDRGERVERLAGTVPLNFVILKPLEGLRTPDVYRAWDALQARVDRQQLVARSQRCLNALSSALRRGALVELGQWMGNRLQAAAAALSPWIDRVSAAFAELDFLGHQLSGSGSAYFGVCRHDQHARRLASILSTRRLGLVYVTRSCR